MEYSSRRFFQIFFREKAFKRRQVNDWPKITVEGIEAQSKSYCPVPVRRMYIVEIGADRAYHGHFFY
ncbi:hypothetical protein [Neobacillus vireti]|uniref:hypothetical protein n=1 Tax=Neobacillus vireti TaxID=220686 RepID=UPI002FFF1CA1